MRVFIWRHDIKGFMVWLEYLCVVVDVFCLIQKYFTDLVKDSKTECHLSYEHSCRVFIPLYIIVKIPPFSIISVHPSTTTNKYIQEATKQITLSAVAVLADSYSFERMS